MRQRLAFTFIELTMVAAIIAILAAIAVPNFLEAKTRGVVSRSRADMALLKMAVESYRLENRAWPPNKTPGRPDPSDLVILTTPVVYIQSVPPDAFTVEESRGFPHGRPMNPTPYRYFNGIQVNPSKGMTIKTKGIGDLEGLLPILDGYVAGLLWGYGPRGGLSMDPGPPVTVISPKGEATILVYDPTNGTTSPGDIYQRIP